ncbi:MAG TPA: arylsulfatase [Candidatus Latescibacteria bacterium]|jgi:arylsulfatase A-like enzyme|nr:arylsulfatase [Candidatus Latescibacterota bacterium]HJP33981.1 arylsulfatase [Candidatus Latescibacterota bacterium]
MPDKNHSDRRPNILFICVDQWRADALSLAGHPVAETPHLDRLARDGINFTQAYASTPTCVPARATIFTGLSPRHTGFVGYNDRIDWRYDATMPGLLADAGYHTQCVGKMHTHPSRNLMGFHNVILHDGYLHRERAKRDDYGLVDDYTPWLREHLGPQADYIDTGVGCNGYAARPWVYDEMLHPTSWVTTQSIDFLRRRDPTKPFFLMMSYHRPHPPLDPPQAFLDRYRAKDLPEPVMGDWAPADPPVRGLDSPVPTDPAQRDYARRAYYAQISHIDYQLNRMFQALFENGVLDDTAILFTSDHGEMLYDHNHVAKGYPFDSSARLPFILRLPQLGNVHQGGRAAPVAQVDQVVELRDLLPTFCDLAGVEVPGHVDGRSILPLTQGETAHWRPYLHGEHFLGGDSNQWLTDGHEKYIWYSQTGRELLFDLDTDPTELRDLTTSRPERLRLWRERLIAELAGREEGFVQGDALVAGRPQGPTLADAGQYRVR